MKQNESGVWVDDSGAPVTTEDGKPFGPKLDDAGQPVKAEDGTWVSAEAVTGKPELTPQPVDLPALTKEYQENGKLSEQTLKNLEAVGITGDMVTNYISGQKAQASQIEQEMFAVVGGNEAYSAMIEWAGENLSAEEIEAFDATVTGSDVAAMKAAISGLHEKFKQKTSNPAALQIGQKDATPVGGNAGFTTQADFLAAQADPKYRAEGAEGDKFRAEVIAKLKVSSWMRG